MPKSSKQRNKERRKRAPINNGARGSHPNDYLADFWDMGAGSSIKERLRRTAWDAMYKAHTALVSLLNCLVFLRVFWIVFDRVRSNKAKWKPVSVQEKTIILELGRSRGRVLVSRAIAESEFIRGAMRWRSTSKTDEAIKVFKDVIAKPTSDLIMQYLQFDMTCGTLMWLWVDTFAAQGLKDAADILIMPRLLSVLRGRYPYAVDDTNTEEDGRRMPEVD